MFISHPKSCEQLLGRTVSKLGLKIVPIWKTNKKNPTGNTTKAPVNTFPLAEGGKTPTCIRPKLLKRDVKKQNPVNKVAEFEKRDALLLSHWFSVR